MSQLEIASQAIPSAAEIGFTNSCLGRRTGSQDFEAVDVAYGNASKPKLAQSAQAETNLVSLHPAMIEPRLSTGFEFALASTLF